MSFWHYLYTMMRDWHPIGQFVFLSLVGIATLGTVMSVLRLAVVAVRGWPPPGTPDVWANPGAPAADERVAPPARPTYSDRT